MDVSLYIFIAAFALDLLFGDPNLKWHLVNVIGVSLKKWENLFFKFKNSGTFFCGAVFAITGIVFFVSIYVLLSIALNGFLETRIPDKSTLIMFLFNSVIVYFCVAFRSMIDHAKPVYLALNNKDLPKAQNEVQKIVGRDSSLLDSSGVANAAIESVSESYVDGFFAPLFWFAIGGALSLFFEFKAVNLSVFAILIYRTVNTLDSIVGYKSSKYLKFGKFSARLDDALNYFPARISIVSLTVAVVLFNAILKHFLKFDENLELKKLSDNLELKQALIVWKRDRRKHASPNSAHSQSFFAGALGIQLGGPATYSYGRVDKPFLGDKKRGVSSLDIQKAMSLYSIGGAVSILLLILVFFLFLVVN